MFGRVLPALGIALPIGNLFYAWLAWQLAKREGRDDVTALPYGPSVPHMFIVVFLVMLPTYLKTSDPILAWQAGLAWAFIIGIIILAGRLRRADDPQVYAARRDAGRAGRHLDRVHLDASRRAELAGAMAGLRLSRHHPGIAGARACGCRGDCRADWPRWESARCSHGSPPQPASAR